MSQFIILFAYNNQNRHSIFHGFSCWASSTEICQHIPSVVKIGQHRGLCLHEEFRTVLRLFRAQLFCLATFKIFIDWKMTATKVVACSGVNFMPQCTFLEVIRFSKPNRGDFDTVSSHTENLSTDLDVLVHWRCLLVHLACVFFSHKSIRRY